jgi:hypothetical protein
MTMKSIPRHKLTSHAVSKDAGKKAAFIHSSASTAIISLVSRMLTLGSFKRHDRMLNFNLSDIFDSIFNRHRFADDHGCKKRQVCVISIIIVAFLSEPFQT